MCAQFHPTKDLIVSCSLDQTLRLWDFSTIRKKYSQSKSQNNEYASNEVEIHAVLEGHERGVNWCSFHPTLNLIVSAADDKKVKIWKYSETKAWEHDSLFGHTSNVCCVVFHPKIDIIISNGEDKTTRVWDLTRRTCIETFKKNDDRFWIAAAHPENYYFAAGADNGIYVLSLFKDHVPS